MSHPEFFGSNYVPYVIPDGGENAVNGADLESTTLGLKFTLVIDKQVEQGREIPDRFQSLRSFQRPE